MSLLALRSGFRAPAARGVVQSSVSASSLSAVPVSAMRTLEQVRGLATPSTKNMTEEEKRKMRRDRRRRADPIFKQPMAKNTMFVLSNGATFHMPYVHPESFPVLRMRTDTANTTEYLSPKQIEAAKERDASKDADKSK